MAKWRATIPLSTPPDQLRHAEAHQQAGCALTLQEGNPEHKYRQR